MRPPSGSVWRIAAAAFAAAACIFAVLLLLSVTGGNMLWAGLSGALVILSVAFSVSAWTMGSRAAKLEEIYGRIRCMRLKKPGIERTHSDEIVPKGKMPKE